ncbi:unnamed protein product, partial [Debaryomyces tyrocola]
MKFENVAVLFSIATAVVAHEEGAKLRRSLNDKGTTNSLTSIYHRDVGKHKLGWRGIGWSKLSSRDITDDGTEGNNDGTVAVEGTDGSDVSTAGVESTEGNVDSAVQSTEDSDENAEGSDDGTGVESIEGSDGNADGSGTTTVESTAVESTAVESTGVESAGVESTEGSDERFASAGRNRHGDKCDYHPPGDNDDDGNDNDD